MQGSGGALSGILNAPVIEAVSLTARREFSSNLRAFIDFSSNKNTSYFPFNGGNYNRAFSIPSTAPNNPFNQNIVVTVPFPSTANDEYRVPNETRSLVAGVIAGLPGKWRGAFDHTWATSRLFYGPPLSFSSAGVIAVQNGTIDVLRDVYTFRPDVSTYLTPSTGSIDPYRSTLHDTAVRLSGPTGFHVPGGPVTVSSFVEYLTERMPDARQVQFGSATETVIPSRSQSVASAYVESILPLIGPANELRAAHSLDLQMAIRGDSYKTEGAATQVNAGAAVPRGTNKTDSVNPTFALRYQPTGDIVVRASYGKGFLPPAVDQLAPTLLTNVGQGNILVDPRRGNTTFGNIDSRQGGNPDLLPEKSESVSYGFIFEPTALPRLRFSVDYTKIKKRDNITSLTTQQILDNEALFPERVTRGQRLATDPPTWAGPVVAVDSSAINLSRATVEAYDFQVDFGRSWSEIGDFTFLAGATWQTHYRTQLLPTQPFVENVGITSSFPLKLRANAGLSWAKGNLKVSWLTRYFDSYLVAGPASSAFALTVANQGATRVPHQIYHDISGSYTFSPGSQRSTVWDVLTGVELRFGVRNIFNTSPPFDASAGFRYFYSPFGDPRLASYYLTLRKKF